MDREHPLKVILLASSYPRSADDTASVFLRYLAECLYKRGLEVHVLAPADRESGSETEKGVAVHRFRYFPGTWQRLAYGSGILPNLKRTPLLWVQVPFFLASMTYSLLRLMREIQPDILHAHWLIPQGTIAVLIKFFRKIPVITTVHGGDVFALRGTLLGKIKRFALRRSDAWTSNTRASSDAVGDGASVPRPQIIPMGVDIERFASGNRNRLREGLGPDENVVLFVGRLVEKKGVDDLIQAFSLLPTSMQAKTRLWIVGSGEQETALRAQGAHLGISEKITLWGKISNNELPDFYAAADLFVGPSVMATSGDTEGQGVVFLEAFAARLCVLATRIGGISEVVESGKTGLLVEPRNPEMLANGIAKLLNNTNLRARLASNAFEKVVAEYDWNNIAGSFEEIYRCALSV
jgi:glycosyltransferase involved in cell wall biosynthesis